MRIIVHKSCGKPSEKWGLIEKYGDSYIYPTYRKHVMKTEVDFIVKDNEMIYKSNSCKYDNIPDEIYNVPIIRYMEE